MQYLNAEQKITVALIRSYRERELTEFETFLRRYNGHDWWHGYSDDGAIWRAGQAAEKQLHEMFEQLQERGEIKDPRVVSLIEQGFSREEARRELFEMYPFLQYYYTHIATAEPLGLLGCALNQVPDDLVQDAITFINALDELYLQLPEDSRGRFVMTRRTPSITAMRDIAVGERLDIYYGAGIPEPLQLEVYKLFERLTPRVLEVIFKYNLVRDLDCAITQLTLGEGETDDRQPYLFISTPHKQYRFFI